MELQGGNVGLLYSERSIPRLREREGHMASQPQSLGPASLMLTQTGDTSGASDLTMAHEPDMGWREPWVTIHLYAMLI